MDKNQKKNRNYEKTEEAIIEALVKLYRKHKNINRITVKSLCEEANISRSTFYLHYQDMIDIFETIGYKFTKSLKEIVVEISKQSEFDFEVYIKQIFGLLGKSHELIRIGLSSEYPFVYIEKLKNDLEAFILNNVLVHASEKEKVQTMFEIKVIVSGLIDVVISYIKNGEKDLDKYIPLLNNFLVKWSNTLFV